MKRNIVFIIGFSFIVLTVCFITSVQAEIIAGYDDCEGGWATTNCCCDIQYHIHDLDRVFPLGTKLTIKYRAGTPDGHCKGDKAYIYVSENNETWTLTGEEDVPERIGADDIIHTKEYHPSISFRYVKVDIPNCYNDWSSASVLIQAETGYDDCGQSPASTKCCCFVKYHIHDLAEIFPSGSNLKIKYCAGTPGGHCKGDTAYFYVSEDEETWTLIGQENVPERAGINDIIHTKDYNPSTSFRYVKVYIPECYNDWSSAEALMKGNNGYSYEVFIDTEVTWHQAKAIAEDMGGYLATITSAEEQQFIEDLLISSGAPTGAYWFGLVETGTEGIYTWDNGESLSYTNWDNNQPDNYQGADSGQILWTVEPEAHTFNRRGKWDDVLSEGIKESLHYPDLDRRGYIVESQPTECIEDDSGSIDITGKAGPCGGKLTIPVRIQDAPATANSIGFDVAFDSGVLIYTGFARGELAEPFDFFNVTEISDGLVRCGGFKTEELAEGSVGDLLYLQFDVSAKCHDSKLELRELKDDISTWTASHGCFSMKCTGDVNNDGEITPKDALCVFEKYLEICPTSCGIPCDEVCGDVTADGECTPADGLCIFRKYLEIPGCLDQ